MKSKILFFLLLIAGFLVQPAGAQPRVIGTLTKRLTTQLADTNKVNLLHHLSYEYYAWGGDPEKTRLYADQCLKLAVQLRYNYGIALGFNAIGRYYLKKNRNVEALEYFERALTFYEKAGRKLGLAVIYRSIGMVPIPIRRSGY
jgi:tetratricopeptide (TPR) repeat protein